MGERIKEAVSPEGLPCALWRLGADGTVQSGNARAETLLPGSRRPGLNLREVFAPPEQTLFLEALARARAAPIDALVLKTLVGADRAPRSLQWSMQAFGGEGQLLATAVDVDQAVRRSQYYEQILDAIPDFVLVKRSESHLQWANRAFCEYYGMTNEQLHELIDAPFTNPDFTKQYVLDDQWVWQNKRPLVIDCEPVTRYDGVVRRFQTVKSPILDDRGEVVFTVGISRDITDRLIAEEKSAESAKMASLGEMAGGIAHEINNPMSVILGKTRQLQRALEDGPIPAERLGRALALIERNGDRVTKIVHGLRRFSRDSSSDPFEPVSLASIVEDTLSLCASRFRNAEIDLRTPVVPPDLILHCRPGLIAQVLLNLLNNAYDSITESPPDASRDRWVEVRLADLGDEIHLRVLDSGPGVPPEIETRIMQPFFTTKPIGKGTGLGLSVSASIAGDHGGSLRLDRDTSPSCFLLTLRKDPGDADR